MRRKLMICLAYSGAPMEPDGTEWNLKRAVRRPSWPSASFHSAPGPVCANLWNKTGTFGNRVLYVDNRGIAGLAGCVQRIGSFRGDPSGQDKARAQAEG